MRRPLSWSSWGRSALVLEEVCLTLISQMGMLSPARGKDLSRVTQRVSGRLTLWPRPRPSFVPWGPPLRSPSFLSEATSPSLGPSYTHTHTHQSQRNCETLRHVSLALSQPSGSLGPPWLHVAGTF